MPFCSYCGKPISSGGAFCPSCGAAVPGGVGSPGPSSPPAPFPPGAPPPLGYGGPYVSAPLSGPTPASRAADRRSLTYIEWASVLLILSGIVGAVVEFSGRLTGLIGATTTSAGTTISLPSPWFWVGYFGVLVAVELATLVLIHSSFRSLVPVDRRFSSPSTLAVVAIVGVAFAVVGGALLFAGLYQAVNCVGSGHPLTRGCLFTGLFVGGLVLVVVGAIALLVGYIGILIGIWRLGTRHDESLLKVAAILLIFPFVNIVGAILMLVGARSSLRKVDAMAGPPPPQGAA